MLNLLFMMLLLRDYVSGCPFFFLPPEINLDPARSRGARVTKAVPKVECDVRDDLDPGGTAIAKRTRGGKADMKRNQYLPAKLAGLALLVLLWQAEVDAKTKGKKREGSEALRFSGGDRNGPVGVTKSQQLGRRSRSSMRQRALIYEPAIAAAAAKYKVDPRALWTIAYLETRFRANQRSPKGAQGLMQFMPGTAKRFNLAHPYNGNESIEAAAQYVAELSRRFNGRLDLVLASYNSGETAVDCYLNGRAVRTRSGHIINRGGVRNGGIPPYAETQKYVRRGLLVFTRVASASVFSPELVANVRGMDVPQIAATAGEVLSVNSELAGLGGAPAILYGIRNIAPAANGIAAVNPKQIGAAPPEQEFDTVFFDVNSGARYLVKSGRIVKPLESVVEDSKVEGGGAQVTKSVYFGMREK
jgi:hypothetical protein